MIRRTLLLGLLVLAALILGTPGLVGWYLERNFDHYVAKIDHPGIMRVVGRHFQRGWFKSSAQITVQLDDRFCAGPPCATFTLESTIYQGPLAFSAPLADNGNFTPAWAVVVSRLNLSPLWPRLAFEPPLEPLRMVSRIGLDGRINSRGGLPAARLEVSRRSMAAHVDMARLSAHMKTALGGAPLDLTVAWPLLRVNGARRGRLELQGLRGGLVTAGRHRDRIVEQHLRVNSLTLGDGKKFSTRMDKIVWRAEAVPGDADGMATRFTGRIGRIVADSGEYGPLLATGRIEGVDLGLWRALKNQFIAGGNDDGTDTSALRTLYNLYLPPVLAAGPVIDVKRFSLMTPKGEVRGRVHIAVPAGAHAPDSLSALLDQVSLSFHGRVPAALLRRAVRHIATSRNLLGRTVTSSDVTRALKLLSGKGLIQPLDGGRAYQLRVMVNQGRIRINGQSEPDWGALLETLKKSSGPPAPQMPHQ